MPTSRVQQRKERIALTDDIARIIWICLALVLVGSSLALRRLPTGNLLKLVLVWLAIFAVVALGVSAWMSWRGGG